MPSSHIITAVLMSAPASIAVSKLICPETEISHTKDTKALLHHGKQMTKHRSVLDAAVRGAQDAVSIVVAVVATIIAFLSILSFLNSVVGYLGELVNVSGLSLEQKLVAYPLMPVSYVLGVAWEDCGPVSEVIGLKTFVNELVGYQRLEEIVRSGGIKHVRSQVIAMYALCGFSNPTTVGVTLGGLSAMVPEKREVIVNIILMSWLAGCLACFMTAAWAGESIQFWNM
ncbi:sodium/nucleoside cotransporter [Elysia marginata]|uniref:Sodium/nucleoside cotransporter n=1 Tax=Elysia marginata TaxID=1093978 RepID=A0AAV4JSP7_9GAST|nr:sodium/nucleoside cotransporter [Elysia marginata]